MYYDPSLGRQGNIEKALRENQYRKNEIFNESTERMSGDTTNRTTVEQAITDLDLMQISAEQTITDLDLRLTVLESEE